MMLFKATPLPLLPKLSAGARYRQVNYVSSQHNSRANSCTSGSWMCCQNDSSQSTQLNTNVAY